jgi:hypothetical protein
MTYAPGLNVKITVFGDFSHILDQTLGDIFVKECYDSVFCINCCNYIEYKLPIFSPIFDIKKNQNIEPLVPNRQI